MVCCFCFVRNRNIYNETKKYYQMQELFSTFKNGEVKLVDSYDSEKSSFSDFIRDSNALSIELQTYDLLRKKIKDNYYEVSINPFYVTGFYEKTDLAEHDFVNERIDDCYYTECKGICVDFNFARDYQLEELIELGRSFSRKEYDCNVKKPIPVILGAAYSSAYKIGEIFSGEYIIEQPLTFVVIGFFKENAVVEIANIEYNLANYIMLPSLSIDNVQDEKEKIILLSTQIEGFVHYDTPIDYQNVATQINEIASTTGFQYIHVESASDYMGKQNYSLEQSRWKYIVSAIFLISWSTLSVVILLYWRRRENGISE